MSNPTPGYRAAARYVLAELQKAGGEMEQP